MTISKELMLSILSTDAYNQGYGKWHEHGETQIDSATASPRDEHTTDVEYDEWQDAGFYATSYTVAAGVEDIDAGTTVISYRGNKQRLAFNPAFYGLI